VNHVARRIGRSLALVLPVVLVLSGTLAVTRVPWATAPAQSQVLTASSEKASSKASARTPQGVLRDRLVAELREKDAEFALTSLQEAMTRRPSLAEHCAEIARALGRAAVEKYGSQAFAQRFSRPVCDTAFAQGVADTAAGADAASEIG
jgi:hypothetical protein